MNDLINQKIRERIEEIEICKEEILIAFIAKYGFHPDEVEIVFKNNIVESTWHIRRKI